MRTLFRLLSCLILLSLTSLSYGFGPNGHRIVGQIASDHLSSKAREQIDKILDGEELAFAATWPDDQRSNPDQKFWGYDAASNWHFINVPPETTYEDSRKEQKGDAFVALNTFIAILKGGPIPDNAVKAELAKKFGDPDDPAVRKVLQPFAVKFIVHIVGDIHQPLHLGYASDSGGNSIKVSWFGQSTELHAVWDSELVNTQKFSFSELSRKIDRASKSDIKKIQDSTIMDWINESLALRTQAYDIKDYNNDFSWSYTYKFVPVIEKQLLHGGLRAAAVFNDIYQ